MAVLVEFMWNVCEKWPEGLIAVPVNTWVALVDGRGTVSVVLVVEVRLLVEVGVGFSHMLADCMISC
jgi:hypothetical protein